MSQWSNIEDEILKAALSKYGQHQWSRISSLLPRKSAKQCKARWNEWLDPAIRKVDWSKEEDEKLLHLAKLMPTQWRTIAPIVGRTATQCLERYQKLLDEAEARESADLGLAGPDGGETAAPSADDVRKLRPGEVDPDPESKPARPDTIDMDEDEKEMLSEARARLANTQGKKAKRKARERQLEESRRLALLQKRRELKNAGINIKIVNRKKGQMDYNADIPFEKQPAPGFYDTREEIDTNERQTESFDPRKQQMAVKRKGDQEDEHDTKRRKGGKDKSAASQAAAKAGQMQKIREAEQQSKRRALVLPAPQVGERELEDIVKMGMMGEDASRAAREGDNETTRGLVGNYSAMVGGTPIRTPRAPPQEDHVANEIRNIRALTEAQSSLLGQENTPLHEGSGSTGFEGALPPRSVLATPNPLATPMNGGPINGVASATPLRTPRDTLAINPITGLPSGATPRDIRLHEQAARRSLKAQLASLPKPKETEWELELPEEKEESQEASTQQEDSAERDRRNAAIRAAAEEKELKRRTQVMQRSLPRPPVSDIDALLQKPASIDDPIERAIAQETAVLIANDTLKFPLQGVKPTGTAGPLERFNDDLLAQARAMLEEEAAPDIANVSQDSIDKAWEQVRGTTGIPGLSSYDDAEVADPQLLATIVEKAHASIMDAVPRQHALEKKLSLHLGGYAKRAETLKGKIRGAANVLEKEQFEVNTARDAQVSEEGALQRRLEALREEVSMVSRREREAQEDYRARKDVLEELLAAQVNRHHD